MDTAQIGSRAEQIGDVKSSREEEERLDKAGRHSDAAAMQAKALDMLGVKEKSSGYSD